MLVSRDDEGKIIAVRRESVGADDLSGPWSEVSNDDPDLQAFVGELSAPAASTGCAKVIQARMEGKAPGLGPHCPRGVTASDAALVRVLEDLINVLVDRGVIRITDLPAAAQAKLTARDDWRSQMHTLSLLDDDSESL